MPAASLADAGFACDHEKQAALTVRETAALLSSAAAACTQRLSVVTAHAHVCARQVLQQRRKLPPVLNERQLFTRAAAFGDRGDPAYHGPCNRIAVHYSPGSMAAAAALFEEFPQVCLRFACVRCVSALTLRAQHCAVRVLRL